MNSAFVGYLAINELRPKAEVDNTLRDVHISLCPTKAEFITCFMSYLLQLTEFVATRENELNSLSCEHHNNSVSKF